MLQQEKADDYVIGTGETHSVSEFIEEAFKYAGMEWKKYVKKDPRYLRPTEVDLLIADYSKAEKELGWTPRVTFKDIVRIMVDADMKAIGLNPVGEGNKILKEKFGDKRWFK